MTKEEKAMYADKKPIGILPLSNYGGIEVLDILDDFVVVRWYEKSIHCVKINYGKRDSFRLFGMTFHFDNIMRL